MKLLFMGAPASGKGTVAEDLAPILNIKAIGPGKLLRALTEDSPHYEEVNEAMDKGILAPNQVTADLLRTELEKEEYAKGFILDGWMRDLEQKDFFDPKPDYVIFIKISDETAIKRISGRRICKDNGETFNIYTFPKEELEKFKDCSEVVQREDDNEETVKTRLQVFHEDTMPVIRFYKNQGNLIEIDGEGTPEEVLELVVESLKKINDKN